MQRKRAVAGLECQRKPQAEGLILLISIGGEKGEIAIGTLERGNYRQLNRVPLVSVAPYTTRQQLI